MTERGDRIKVITESAVIMEYGFYCERPGGPGCKEARSDGPCCGAGDWFVVDHLLDETKQRTEPI